MVTTLKPIEPIEPVPAQIVAAPETPPALKTAPPPVWGYTVPSPGVRYYTTRPAAPPETPAFLPVKLLDEKLMPL